MGAEAPVLILAVVTLITVLLVIKTLLGGSRRMLPPGPIALPIIGNMHQLIGNTHQSLWKLASKYGPIMYLRIGATPLVVVSNAQAAQEFLKTHDKVWAGRPPTMALQILTDNFKSIAGAHYGAYWRHLRKICTLELFTHKRLESFRPYRTEEFNRTVRSIFEESQQGKPVKLVVVLGHLATNNLTRMLLNKRFYGLGTEGQMEAQQFNRLIKETLANAVGTRMIGDFVPWLKWVAYVSGHITHLKKVKAEIDGFIQQFLEVKKSGSEVSTVIGGAQKQEDFVDVLQAQPSETGIGYLNDVTIRQVLYDILLAGTETSSITLEWAIAELIRHPDCMKKLQTEIDNVVGKHGALCEGDIPNLPYLQATVKEVFRLHPTVPILLPHQSLEPSNVCGYDFPSGTRLFINAYAIHRDPTHWSNALQFDPDRFMKNLDIDLKGNHFEFIPFGAGRRMCPGMSLGLVLVTLGLGRLVQAFNFELPCGHDLDMNEKFGITLSKAKPLEVIAKPRMATSFY